MESSGFQSQLLSAVEVLARAAMAEINRRVDDGCAELRLEVSQSRRDIDLLRRKCEVMEAELRRSRMVRARRRVFHPPAGDRFSSLVKIVRDKKSQSTGWERHMNPGSPPEPQQCPDMEPDADHMQIKQECVEEDSWRSEPEEKLMSVAEQLPCFTVSPPAHADSFAQPFLSAEDPDRPDSAGFPVDGFDSFPEQQAEEKRNETELVVKLEKEEEYSNDIAAQHPFETEKGSGQLWMTGLCRDSEAPGVSYTGEQFEHISTSSHNSFFLEDTEARFHSAGRSQSAMISAARAKRRAVTFACKRAQPEDGHLSQMSSSGSIPLATQHQQHRDVAALHDANSYDNPPNAGAPFGLARRMRTPWKSGLGEKRFSCTYCNKGFARFSQLKEHQRCHTGERPYSCEQCGRSFTKQCNLIRHAVVHSGEKPHQCSMCGKCFTQRSSLKSHQKTAH